ncbi:MAG: PAS domain-containing protein [Lewinella sp.]|uniref:PAS domain-containing protein n=1 Tax=Lewinella sp. TaxID=2004506 RepID=UPI003D6BAAE7
MNRLVGIWDYNVDKDILQWDAKMCQIFGTGSEPIKGNIEMFTRLIHPEDLERVTEEVYKTIDGGVIQYDCTYRVVKPDGEEALVHAWGSMFEHDGDRCLIGACDEVTERNYVMKELMRLRDEN